MSVYIIQKNRINGTFEITLYKTGHAGDNFGVENPHQIFA